MADGTTGAGAGEGLRAGLRAAGAMLGVPVVVTDGALWQLAGGELRVGLGWYAERGHGEWEALALAALQLWEGPREELRAPARARRRRTLERRSPAEAPMLAAIARLQAAAELLAAMPGLRRPLAAALARELPPDPSALPRHLQWVVMLLSRGIDGGAPAGLAPEVRREWSDLRALAGAGVDPLRRVLAPDPSRTPVRRLERAVALLRPPYLRLLALDLAERGIAETHPDGAEAPSEAVDTPSLGGEPGGGAGAGDQQAAEAGGDSGSVPEGSDESARRGEGRQAAEGSDLFAAEQAGFARTVLATPLPGGGALVEAVLDLAAEARAEGRADPRETAAGRIGGGSGGGALADYRSRVAELSPAIERMRDLWQRVIAERIAPRPAPGRRPLPEGDELAVEHLAGAVAEARSGIPRPAAFLSRVERPRRTRRAGSTDYVLLVDRSASMQGPAAEAAADAVLVMTEALAGVDRDIDHAEARTGASLELDVRTAVVVFDAEPEVLKPLSRGVDDATRRAVHAAARSPRGSTDDGAALRAAAAELGLVRGERPRPAPDGLERRRIVILVGDGGSNDPASAERELRRLRSVGVEVHGIGIGDDEIAFRYAPHGHRVDDPRDIPDRLEALVADGLA
ncbi:vWA domain-containing protein [Leucobacter ruminantium]|uniref:VWA domain-containing protein n=1 Tax=Leucobacter ruminantium TaxID=1289170 RepID=A0A939LV32_9MICO|nr:vWA domain-containing protein [Leucobacter ruminantium]MBO1804646.1 VWA domain-containing protein [Leucobacter ruminantium]